MDLDLRLLTRAEAERVVRRRRNDQAGDLPWADGYPLDGDSRACAAYVTQLPIQRGSGGTELFGYYQIVEGGVVVGGIGFHGPPRSGMVEIGYGLVPSARGRGLATSSLRRLISMALRSGQVRTVTGRTTEDNLASQRVMTSAGLRLVGRDADFLHFELALGIP